MTTGVKQKAIKALTRPCLRFEAAISRERAAARTAAIIAQAKPGELVEGEGIFLCKWEPKDRDGVSLGKVFNVFAAPTDLTDETGKRVFLSYNDTVKAIALLKNWHGHNGVNFENDTALYEALKSGAYKGRWFIPTHEVLKGSDINGNRAQENNLYDCKDKGKLAGTFTTVTSSGFIYLLWYWSSTERRGAPSHVCSVRFSDGYSSWSDKDGIIRLSCRPVRLVPVSSPA